MRIVRTFGAAVFAAATTTLALAQPQPTPSPSPLPTVSAAHPSARPSATPSYNFIYRATPSPNTTPFPNPGAPEIDEIDLSDATLVPPAIIRVRILTNTYVTTMTAETFGQTLAIPRSGPGTFKLEASVPDVPNYLRNHSFDVTFTAAVTDGRVATVTLPLSIR